MSEQRIVVETHMCVCGQNHTASDLDKLDEVCPAYRRRIVELPDLEKLREALDLLRVNSLVDSVANRWLTRPPVQAVLDAARWVLSLESE